VDFPLSLSQRGRPGIVRAVGSQAAIDRNPPGVQPNVAVVARVAHTHTHTHRGWVAADTSPAQAR